MMSHNPCLNMSLKTPRRRAVTLLLIYGFAFLIFLTFAGSSFAQSSSTPTPPVDQTPIPADTMSTAVNAVVATLTDAFDALVNNDALKEAGTALTNMLFVLVFAWSLVKTMAQGEGINGVVAELIPLCGTLAIIKALLDMGGVGQITSFMDSVATSFGMSGGLADSMMSAIKKGFAACANILTMPSTNTKVPFSWDLIGSAIGVLITSVVSLIARVIAAFLVIIAVAIYLGHVILAHGSIMLATALAPLMVPFILVPSLGFIFDGWLRFTLSAAMIKVVGAFMIGLTDQLMYGLVKLSEKVALPANADYSSIMITNYIVYAGLVLLAGLSAYLMTMVPGLAQGLLSGNGGHGFKGLSPITSGQGFKAGMGAGTAGVNKAGEVGGRAAQAGGKHAASFAQGAAGAILDAHKSSRTANPAQKYGAAGGWAYKRLS